jgi:hypothetical protein
VALYRGLCVVIDVSKYNSFFLPLLGLLDPEEEDTAILRNVGRYLPVDTA